MIDLFLMESLIDAVSPRAQLVLLGDAEQLPSVDTGAVLRDLLPEKLDTSTAWRDLVEGQLEFSMSDEPTAASSMRLQKSYRMDRGTEEGRQIFALAGKVRNGEYLRAEEVAERRRPTDLRWQGVEWFNPGRLASGKVDLYDFLTEYFDAHIGPATAISPFVEFEEGGLTAKSRARVSQLYDHFKKTRILTLTRVFETGSEILNQALHRQFLRRRGQGQDFPLAPGEPVMMLRNDYEKNLFNGDQGVVVMHGKKPQVAFPRGEGFAVFPLAGLSQHLEISFAMTVHKAQGSEFQRVAMVLPGHDMALLTRELLYTGITRAREGAALVGSLSRFNDGVGRPVQRFTAVREKL